jgi:hypothetical protein
MTQRPHLKQLLVAHDFKERVFKKTAPKPRNERKKVKTLSLLSQQGTLINKKNQMVASNSCNYKIVASKHYIKFVFFKMKNL